jgi:hypothetical protein
MSRRRNRCCERCGEPLTGRGGRAVRCAPCQVDDRAERDRARHAGSREEQRSTRRRLQRQGLSEPPPSVPAVHGGDGRSRPPTIITTAAQAARAAAEKPVAERRLYRQNPRHDAATRARLDRDEEAEASDMTTWDALNGPARNGRTVDFHPAQGPGESAPVGWGRPIGRREPGTWSTIRRRWEMRSCHRG